jgi:NlpC/P60 family/Bacterial dipeptidyl-peptidase Sh3 domain
LQFTLFSHSQSLMVSLAQIQAALSAALSAPLSASPSVEYQCLENLNLYDSPALESLATQAVAGRQLRVLPGFDPAQHRQAIRVQLCEDDYPGWLPLEDLDLLSLAEAAYQAITLTELEIQARLPQVIAFTEIAMAQPNYYLWGGTVGPNYDCSGLMQTAFLSTGIWLPRDAYQQEAFVQPLTLDQLQSGDLIFFGTPERTTHVGLCLGDGSYIHSSGKAQGRNGIGIDVLSEQGDAVSQAYFRQVRGVGRVVASYQPTGQTAISANAAS